MHGFVLVQIFLLNNFSQNIPYNEINRKFAILTKHKSYIRIQIRVSAPKRIINSLVFVETLNTKSGVRSELYITYVRRIFWYEILFYFKSSDTKNLMMFLTRAETRS